MLYVVYFYCTKINKFLSVEAVPLTPAVLVTYIAMKGLRWWLPNNPCSI